ncbi:MAG: glycine cleavage system protein GcvH [Clostridia bacterium]|nr:glycine cleavage system protein GcvH [Clostridia bacterium]
MIKYAKTHEWADVDGTVATVGISTFAADELGDVVYFSLPEVGQEVVAGEAMCEVESVKAVSEINAPVSGKVVEVNAELEDSPELVNQDAMAAWICKIEVTDIPADLMDEAEYEAFAK